MIADEGSGRFQKDAGYESSKDEGSFNAVDVIIVGDGLQSQVDEHVCEKMHEYVVNYKYNGPKNHCGCPVRMWPPDNWITLL